MLFIAFAHWWYGPGWRDTAHRLKRSLHHTYLAFSVPILLQTLLSPWRRIVTSGGGSLGQRFRASVDNTVSRFVGLAVRLGALLTAAIVMAATAAAGVVLLIAWPLLPVAGPALIIIGITLL